MTIASTSRPEVSGHQASIRARMSSRPASWSFRWKRTPPQQPAPGTSSNETPMRSSTRAAAALIEGASEGCTHPRSAIMRRAWRGSGQAPAGRVPGALPTSWPSRSATPNRPLRGRPKDRTARFTRSTTPRRVFASTTARPMSSSRPYCTPDGHVVSHARQVRQRSRCRRVLSVTGAPSSARFIR
jgi:hypothetical protein